MASDIFSTKVFKTIQILRSSLDIGLRTPTAEPPQSVSTLETTQGQIDGFFSQLPFKYYLPEVASVGN